MSAPPRSHAWRVALLALLAGLPAVLTTLYLLLSASQIPKHALALFVASAAVWIAVTITIPRRVARPFATFADVIASFREGDYSIRPRGGDGADALAAAAAQLDALGAELHRQRLAAMETSALLSKVVESADLAVFAFDARACLRLTNHEGERLLGRARRDLLARSAADLGLADLLTGTAPRTVSFPDDDRSWELRRSPFRLEGRAHTLVALTPIERALRERERDAWRRLSRVLGHEINNSLAPIRSLAQSSLALLARSPRPEDADVDLARGLTVIADRAASLARLTASFADLARLPAPDLAPVDVLAWIARSAAAETRVPVSLDPGPAVTVRGDDGQLDLLLVNLVRNAADAVLEAGSGDIHVTWAARGSEVEVRVVDGGVGLADQADVFVPFFTTKPTGTGIGLTLARQIAEAHGGTLILQNRPGARGCEARLILPIRGRAG